MPALPKAPSETVRQVVAWRANQPQRLSRRLGASLIGRECERQLWYMFRWSKPEQFDGCMLRLFDRGHREEQVFVDELRAIGCDVRDIDPATGDQFVFTSCGGHSVAKIDGVAIGIPEAPKTWHIVGFKTANDKTSKAIENIGLEKTKPEHIAQNQYEMHLAKLTRTFYLSVNKNDDTLFGERMRYDKKIGEALDTKAERIVFSEAPLARVSEDPAFFKCKFCPVSDICHGEELPRISCRTCAHSTAEKDGDGRWSCARFKLENIEHEHAQKGCTDHIYNPALLSRWGEVVDADPEAGWIKYRSADGHEFINAPGPRREGVNTSKQLHMWSTMRPLKNMHLIAMGNKITDEPHPDLGPVEAAA